MSDANFIGVAIMIIGVLLFIGINLLASTIRAEVSDIEYELNRMRKLMEEKARADRS